MKGGAAQGTLAVLLAAAISAAWLASCGTPEPSERFGADVVAQAYDQQLTWDSLASWVPDDLGLEDSAAFAERVIDRWMREQVMLHQARQHLQAERAQIERALQAYRRSLTINTYETRYVESRLNLDVSDAEIQAYYDSHPELFTLHDHAVRVLYAHVPSPKVLAEGRGQGWSKKDQRQWEARVNEVVGWLAQGDSASIPELERWCIAQGAMHHLDHEAWWDLRDLLDDVPLSLYRVEDQIQSPAPLTFEHEGRVYFVRFLEAGLKGRTAPLDVARTQITELLLQARRQAMLDALRDTLYQQAWARGELRRENL